MSDLRWRMAAIAYNGFARRVHTLLPGGHALRARLADMICEEVAVTSSIEPDVHLSRRLVVMDGAGIGAGTWFLGDGRIILGRRLKMVPNACSSPTIIPFPQTARRSVMCRQVQPKSTSR
jgi:hypothetical protein